LCFSRRLSPAERNYDVGNRELLAVVLALEEWRHWLEGAEIPFVVWTDHKNLAYLQQAKRLTSRQARWALFLGRFNFTLSYRPGSRNLKPDALSRQAERQPLTDTSEPVLPPGCLVGAAHWEVEQQVKRALSRCPRPEIGPPNCLFVPEEVRAQVLLWGHSSRLACHPGAARTLELIRQRFWWHSGSGGPRWSVTPISLWQLAPSVPEVRPLTNGPRAY